MTLYLKYRPQTIEELDSAFVRSQVTAIARSKSIPHAILLSGPKGTGKTSAARILAKVINCDPSFAKRRKGIEPCNKCQQCRSITQGTNVDVIEMDAASNRGIDDIRSLKEKIMLSPAVAKKKVYIIDEVHMMTTEAFNAFLKTLEEPPAHVIFLLATTDPQKIPETVRSRLTTIVFERAKNYEIVRQLKRVARGEKVKVDEEVLLSIASSADGSFRDAVKILEVLLTRFNRLNKDKVEEFLRQTKALDLDNFLRLLSRKDVGALLARVEEVFDLGVNMKNLLERIIERLHREILIKNGVVEGVGLVELEAEDLLNLVELLMVARVQMSGAVLSQLPLELAIIKWVGKEAGDKRAENSASGFDESVWEKILASVKGKNASVEALLRAARPLEYDGKNLKLGVYYRFHKERLETAKNRQVLEEVCAGVLGNSVKISCVLTEKVENLTGTSDPDIISAAKEIFGV